MTCYFRHLGHIFAEIGINVTAGNRKQIDKRIHEMVGVAYHNCPMTWMEIKKRLAEDRMRFTSDLENALLSFKQ